MIGSATRELVRQRAGGRCEYCRIHEDDEPFVFHLEHIIPIKHGGNDDPSNLAWSCHSCNLAKGANLSGRLQDETVPLFHPRQQQWNRHFRWIGSVLAWCRHIRRPCDSISQEQFVDYAVSGSIPKGKKESHFRAVPPRTAKPEVASGVRTGAEYSRNNPGVLEIVVPLGRHVRSVSKFTSSGEPRHEFFTGQGRC